MTNQYFAEQATARKRPLIRKKASPKALVAIEEDAAGFQDLRVTEKESATRPLASSPTNPIYRAISAIKPVA